MTGNPVSYNPIYMPTERRGLLHVPQAVRPYTSPANMCLCEYFLMEPPPPPPPPVIFLPPKWYKIPQERYKQKQWDYKPVQDIPFPVNGLPGLNLGEALRKRFTTLEGRDDLVLQNAAKAFSCRFWFPGYPLNKSPQVFTTLWNKKRDPITRSKLAHQIARKLQRYLDSMSSSYVIDPSVDPRWQIGQGYMHLETMYLAKLKSVSKGSYQPEIWVVNPTVN